MKINIINNTTGALANRTDSVITNVAGYPKFDRFFEKLNKNEEIFQNIVFGTLVGRQIIKMVLYTSMSWFNKELPPEQRRFAASWDFFQSLLATMIMATVGMYVNSNSKKWAEKLFKKDKNNLKQFELAKLGFRTALTVIGMEFIAYRTILPLVGTPIAKHIKEKYLVSGSEPQKNTPQ